MASEAILQYLNLKISLYWGSMPLDLLQRVFTHDIHSSVIMTSYHSKIAASSPELWEMVPPEVCGAADITI